MSTLGTNSERFFFTWDTWQRKEIEMLGGSRCYTILIIKECIVDKSRFIL